MAFYGVFPMAQDPIRPSASVGPQGPVGTTQTQQSGTQGQADRTITIPKDLTTLTYGGITVTLNPSMQDPSSYIGQLNSAGIPCTIDINGHLNFTGSQTTAPTSNDANLLKVLGVT